MINVLDRGFVRLVDHMGSDLSVVRSARVSYDAEWRAGEDAGSDARLIKYLWRNQHSSPFESVQFTFEVKAPIFVLRQWQRHRTQSYNEVSARYTELPTDYYLPDSAAITTQASDNKQMRTAERHPKAALMRGMMKASNESAFKVYQALIAEGCPRELARTVLPAATYSRMFVSMNLLNLFKFLRLREAVLPEKPHAQHEIQVYAAAMLELIKPVVPVCVEAFLNETK